jgi:hypothetical protein
MVIKKIKEYTNGVQFSSIYYFNILTEIWVSHVVKDLDSKTYTVFLFTQQKADIYEIQYHHIPIDDRILITDLIEKCYIEINNLHLVNKTRLAYNDFENYFRLAKFDMLNI